MYLFKEFKVKYLRWRYDEMIILRMLRITKRKGCKRVQRRIIDINDWHHIEVILQ